MKPSTKCTKPPARRCFVLVNGNNRHMAEEQLRMLAKIVSIIPPDENLNRDVWRFDLENAAWPSGPWEQATLSMSQDKEGYKATTTLELVLP